MGSVFPVLRVDVLRVAVGRLGDVRICRDDRLGSGCGMVNPLRSGNPGAGLGRFYEAGRTASQTAGVTPRSAVARFRPAAPVWQTGPHVDETSVTGWQSAIPEARRIRGAARSVPGARPDRRARPAGRPDPGRARRRRGRRSSRRAAPARRLGPFAGDGPATRALASRTGRTTGASARWCSTSRHRRRPGRACERLVAGADVLIDRPRRASSAALGPRLRRRSPRSTRRSSTSRSRRSARRPEGRLGRAPTSSLMAAGGTLSLTGDADRPPLRMLAAPGLHHAAAEAAGAALIALRAAALRAGPARRRLGAGVDAAGAPSRRCWPRRRRPIVRAGRRRRAAAAARRPPRSAGADGHVSITFLFGTSSGPSPAASWSGCTRRASATRPRATRTGSATPCSCDDRRGADRGVRAGQGLRRRPSCAPRRRPSCSRRRSTARLLIAPVATRRGGRAAQLAARDYWHDVDGPDGGAPSASRAPFASSRRTPLPRSAPPPRLGEHTAEVLRASAAPAAAGAGRRRRTARPPGAAARWPGSRCSTSCGRWPARPPPGCSPTTAPPWCGSSRSTSIDGARTCSPFSTARPARRTSALFHNINAGKLGLTLDLSQARGPRRRARPRALGRRRARVVLAQGHEGAGASTTTTLREVNPDLIMLSTLPDGPDRPAGPLRRLRQPGRRDHRLLQLTGWPDRPPVGPSAPTPTTSRPASPWPRCWPRSTTAAAPARASTSTSPRPRRRCTSSARRCSTTPSTAGCAARDGNDDRALRARTASTRAAGDDRWVAIAVDATTALAGAVRRRWRRARPGRASPRPSASARADELDELVAGLDRAARRGRGRAPRSRRGRARPRRAQQPRELAPTRSSRTAATSSPPTTPCTAHASVEGTRFALSRTPPAA